MREGFSVGMDGIHSGISPVPSVRLAVVNTCTVTGKAEQKARRVIRMCLEHFPNAVVLVTGCYAELEKSSIQALSAERVSILPGTKKHLLAELPAAMCGGGALSVFEGRFSKTSLDAFLLFGAKPPVVVSAQAACVKRMEAVPSPGQFVLYTPVFSRHSRASLKIQDGCDNACTFCRIHLARGRSVSLDADEVLRRVQELERQGRAEVVFTGVNLSQYRGRSQAGGEIDFAGILQQAILQTERIKFRISSFYPQHVTERLCEVISHRRVQPSFHLSVQSGSGAVLSRMARPYGPDDVLLAVKRLRAAKHEPFVSCDIIAGFPGETKQDFELTQRLCTEVDFAWIHAFPFSPRPGTPAANMDFQVPDNVKAERVRWLTDYAVCAKMRYISAWSGKTVEAVVEDSRTQNAGTVHAVTENFLHVECPLPPGNEAPLPGTVANIKLLCAEEDLIRSGAEIDCLGEYRGSASAWAADVNRSHSALQTPAAFSPEANI